MECQDVLKGIAVCNTVYEEEAVTRCHVRISHGRIRLLVGRTEYLQIIWLAGDDELPAFCFWVGRIPFIGLIRFRRMRREKLCGCGQGLGRTKTVAAGPEGTYLLRESLPARSHPAHRGELEMLDGQ